MYKKCPPPPGAHNKRRNALKQALPTMVLMRQALALLMVLPLLTVLLMAVRPTAAHAQSSAPLTNFPTFNNTVRAIAISGTTIYVGGSFTQATDAPANGGMTATRNFIAAIDATTGALLPWNPNANGLVFALAVSGTNVYVGGFFATIGGVARASFAAFGPPPVPAPAIGSVSSTAVSPGATIVITGSGFTGATAVSIGGVPVASFTINSDNQITIVVGSGTPGTGGQQQLLITTPAGIVSLGGFSVGAASASSGSGSAPSGGTTVAPQNAVIGGISPPILGFGTPIVVSGSGFTVATGLFIGDVAVTNFVVVNDNTITAVVGGVPVSDRIVLTGGAGASLDMSRFGDNLHAAFATSDCQCFARKPCCVGR
ncbi:MAG: hypothetical protein ACOVSW_24400 [Candidatus Kapaibacteriota bacterium]